MIRDGTESAVKAALGKLEEEELGLDPAVALCRREARKRPGAVEGDRREQSVRVAVDAQAMSFRDRVAFRSGTNGLGSMGYRRFAPPQP